MVGPRHADPKKLRARVLLLELPVDEDDRAQVLTACAVLREGLTNRGVTNGHHVGRVS